MEDPLNNAIETKPEKKARQGRTITKEVRQREITLPDAKINEMVAEAQSHIDSGLTWRAGNTGRLVLIITKKNGSEELTFPRTERSLTRTLASIVKRLSRYKR
jgi:hypothetical protein